MMRSGLMTLSLAALLYACPGGGGGEDPGRDGSTSGERRDGGHRASEEVTTTLFGTVVDRASQAPLLGVEVEAYGSTATTGSDGTFVFEALTVPRERCALMARRSGYFAAARAAVPVEDGVTRLRLQLEKKVAQQVEAGGGTVSLGGGASVQFQADGFSQWGGAYTDPVQVAVRHLDPSAAGFDDLFPGDLAARRGDGSASMLVSYGVVQVEMENAWGDAIELAEGKPATLAFPVPASMQGAAPQSLPLWYFDEEEAIWKEEGTATLQGGSYVGEVRHFTAWNADMPQQTAWVAGHVTCAGKVLAGIGVQAGPSTGTTDSDGYFLLPVPANTVVTVSVLDDAAQASLSRQAGPVPPQEVEDVGILALSVCPARLKARVVGKDGAPVDARVALWWAGQENAVAYALAGVLDTLVPADTDVTLEAVEDGGGGETVRVTPRSPGPGEELDLGTLTVDFACAFWDFDVEADEVALSPQGDLLAVSSTDGSLVEVRDARTGAVKHSLATVAVSDLQFSADGTRLLTGTLWGGHPMVWDLASGARLQEFAVEIESALLMPDGASILARISLQLEQDSVADGSKMRRFAAAIPDPFLVLGLTHGGQDVVIVRNDSDAVRSLTVWNLASDAEVLSFTLGRDVAMGDCHEFALSADGSTLAFQRAVDGGGAGVAFLDTATGQAITAPFENYPVGGASSPALALAPDGASFVTQSEPSANTLEPPVVYALPSLARLHTLPCPFGRRLDHIAYSADGRLVALVSNSTMLRIVDLTTCR